MNTPHHRETAQIIRFAAIRPKVGVKSRNGTYPNSPSLNARKAYPKPAEIIAFGNSVMSHGGKPMRSGSIGVRQ
jgi:hypothetical protein